MNLVLDRIVGRLPAVRHPRVGAINGGVLRPELGVEAIKSGKVGRVARGDVPERVSGGFFGLDDELIGLALEELGDEGVGAVELVDASLGSGGSQGEHGNVAGVSNKGNRVLVPIDARIGLGQVGLGHVNIGD